MSLKSLAGKLISKAGKLCTTCCFTPIYCWYKIGITYNCDTSSWGDLAVDKFCTGTDPVPATGRNSWISDGNIDNVYFYSLWLKGDSCQSTGDCPTPDFDGFPNRPEIGDPPCPAKSSTCRCSDNTTSWAISGYSDGFFAVCDGCHSAEGDVGVTPWDGVFIDTGSCVWRGVDTGSLSIGGKRFAGASIILVGQNTSDSCFWELQIFCEASGPSSVWIGRKYTGTTAGGEYTRTGGCDTRATVTVA